MSSLLAKKNSSALCISERDAVFANVKIDKKTGGSLVMCLATATREDGDEIGIKRLLADVGRKKARVAVVLPLSSFELIPVTVPPVSPEAVIRLLPYNLSKVIDKPVTDYIYDYQVSQKFKDRLELTVYLYPVEKFHLLKKNLHSRQKDIFWLEPDLFAAFSYLESASVFEPEAASICVLIWKSTISMAVYENHRITLVRSVDLIIPGEEYSPDVIENDKDSSEPEEEIEIEIARDESDVDEADTFILLDEKGNPEQQDEAEEENVDTSLFFEDDEDFLAGFGLQQDDVPEPEEEEEETDPEPADTDQEEIVVKEDWSAYLEDVKLEVMRTGDYHTSVLKGKAATTIYVGGAEGFYEPLAKGLNEMIHGMAVHSFPPEEIEADCRQLMAALSVGALNR